ASHVPRPSARRRPSRDDLVRPRRGARRGARGARRPGLHPQAFSTRGHRPPRAEGPRIGERVVMGPNSADLARLSATVLADCAFLLTEPVEDDAEPDDPVHAVIAFRGATNGRLVLSASRDLAEVVAADMMGLSVGDPEARAHAEGAVAELANVLLGMLVVKFC